MRPRKSKLQNMNQKKATSAGIERQTLNLWPDTGKILGLGRNSTFEAAKRGDIPTIRIGGRILVPKQSLDRLLGAAVS